MLRCSHCGAEFSEWAARCPACRRSVAEVADPEAETPATEPGVPSGAPGDPEPPAAADDPIPPPPEPPSLVIATPAEPEPPPPAVAANGQAEGGGPNGQAQLTDANVQAAP